MNIKFVPKYCSLILVAFRKYRCQNWGTLLVSRLCRLCPGLISPFSLACSRAMSSNSAVSSRAFFSLGALPSPPPSADLRSSGSSPTSISPQLHFSDGFFFPFLFPFPFLWRPPPRPRPWPEFNILFNYTNHISHVFLSWNTYIRVRYRVQDFYSNSILCHMCYE